MTTVRFDQVTKSYGDRVAVEPFSAVLDDATWCVVIGPNGSGKTTLLGMVAGLIDPTEGAITIDDAAAGTRNARGAVSYVSDTPAFYSDLTVAEHIDYIAGLYGDDGVVDRAVRFVEDFGLAPRADDLPDTFSRGMKQKTALSLTLSRPASVFLLDEPTRGLDTKGAETLVEILRGLHADGATIMTVTHEPEKFEDATGVVLEANDASIRQLPNR